MNDLNFNKNFIFLLFYQFLHFSVIAAKILREIKPSFPFTFGLAFFATNISKMIDLIY